MAKRLHRWIECVLSEDADAILLRGLQQVEESTCRADQTLDDALTSIAGSLARLDLIEKSVAPSKKA